MLKKSILHAFIYIYITSIHKSLTLLKKNTTHTLTYIYIRIRSFAHLHHLTTPLQHRLLQPIPLVPFAPIPPAPVVDTQLVEIVEPQTQATDGYSKIWQNFANSKPLNLVYSNFDDEAEFVPLEQQQHQQQQHQLHQGRAGSPNAREKPFGK